MKNVTLFILLCCLPVLCFPQNKNVPPETGLPGDHFSLEGALELFKTSVTPGAFEQALNTQDNHVNNLDLNDDGETDYITVISKQDKDVHIFILRALLSEDDFQDIAVIEVEKTNDEEAVIQIIGDKDIFGDEVIAEPVSSDDQEYAYDDLYDSSDDQNILVTVNVWGWPSVRYIYGPVYHPWVSPWHWRTYPVWFRPWRPFAWSAWHPLKMRYHRHGVRIVHTHRTVRAGAIYHPVRRSSVIVRTRYAGAHANYKVNRNKTTVTGPRGKTVTKKSTSVRGPKGNVRVQKTTVKKSRRG